MTITEELKEIAAGLMRRVDITTDSLPTQQTEPFDVWAKCLLAIAEQLDAAVIVPIAVADYAVGTVALLGDESVLKFGNPSPAAKRALRNLAAALGWKDGKL